MLLNKLYTGRKHWRRSVAVRISARLSVALVVVALFANLIANDKPLIIKSKSEVSFPAFRSLAAGIGVGTVPGEWMNTDWKNLDSDWAAFPPIPYSPQSMDKSNVHSVSPFDRQNVSSLFGRHWLGTDELGRDILSGLIHGTGTALSIGLLAMSLAALLGILMGALAGYFADDQLRISIASLVTGFLFLLPACFIIFIVRRYELSDALAGSLGAFIWQLLISLLLLIVFLFAAKYAAIPLKRISFLNKRLSIPLDIIISRFIETVDALPVLLLLITASAILAKPSIYVCMIIIGLVSWTSIARLVRAEMLRIRALEYIEAARALGILSRRIILTHALPNALSPVLVTIAFGIASSILIEASLSFLGVGIPAEEVTWGSILASAHQSPSSWWLAVFPGTAIFITVYVFNLLGEGLTENMNGRQKSFLE